MTLRTRLCLVALSAIVVAGALAPPASAQVTFRSSRPVLRVGQDLALDVDADVREVVVVFGSLTLEGRVSRDVFVWLGDVRLAPTAVIDGSLIVVAGDAHVERGATIGRDLAVIGGTLDAPADFAPGGEFAMVGAPALGRGVRGFIPWVTRGLLWGRPIVPDVPWVWTVVGIFFLLALALTLIFGQAVRASSSAVVLKPLRTFLTGMVVLVVTGPLIVILAATVVGLVVVPVVIFALLAAWTIGKVGVARGIGGRILHESDPESRVQAVRSLVIGFTAIVLAYMVPVLGLVTWSLVSVFGLGAATMAALAAIRREYPRKPKPAAPASVPPPSISSDADAGPSARPMAFDAPLHEPAVEPDEADDEAPIRSTSLVALPRGQFLERTAAFAIDCVLIAIVDRFLDSRQDGVFFFLLVSYHVAFWTWQATTLGGIIIGLRVVRTDGDQVRFVDALVRGLSSVFSVAALGIGCFWMLWDAERQTWHDKIAGTYVVKVPRGMPLR